MQRSATEQIEHWALIGKLVEENPDLPFSFIRDLKTGLEDIKAGKVAEYKFGKCPSVCAWKLAK